MQQGAPRYMLNDANRLPYLMFSATFGSRSLNKPAALTGLLMLIPAELFKVTRLLVPASGVALVHLFVVTAYIGAVIGMYGMFYPWRLEKGMAWFQSNALRFRLLGFVCLVWGAALLFAGFALP
jgi:hypothetical protein